MSASEDPWIRGLRETVLEGPGVTSTALRARIVARGAGDAVADGDHEGLTSAVSQYVDRIRDAAHTMDDQDLERLREDGYDDDGVFEVTVVAAVGAGLARLERVRALLRAEASR
ncbi:MAG: hypothetical protein R3F39_22220 [Myxococcota bacterium]